MDKELEHSKAKEQKKLNLDLKQMLDKSTKLNLQKWRAKISDELNSRQAKAINAADNSISLTIENRNRQKLEQQQIIQKRLVALKTEKSKLSALASEKQRVKSKLEQIEQKLKRFRIHRKCCTQLANKR